MRKFKDLEYFEIFAINLSKSIILNLFLLVKMFEFFQKPTFKVSSLNLVFLKIEFSYITPNPDFHTKIRFELNIRFLPTFQNNHFFRRFYC